MGVPLFHSSVESDWVAAETTYPQGDGGQGQVVQNVVDECFVKTLARVLGQGNDNGSPVTGVKKVTLFGNQDGPEPRALLRDHEP